MSAASEANNVIAIIALVVTFFGGLGVTIAFLLNRISAGDAKCHDRVDRLRDETMTRADINRAMDKIEKGIEGVHDRMDNLTNALIAGGKVTSE